jgi:hypothetical protein
MVPVSALLAEALLAQAIGNFHLLKITRVQCRCYQVLLA